MTHSVVTAHKGPTGAHPEVRETKLFKVTSEDANTFKPNPIIKVEEQDAQCRHLVVRAHDG